MLLRRRLLLHSHTDRDIFMSENGSIDDFLSRLLGRSYRTTIGGLATFVCGVVVAVDHFVAHPLLHTVAGVCTALGLAGAGAVGLAAKDARVSGLPK